MIIGVHSPEFAFEKSLANVKNAVEMNDIQYPVALDNDHQTFQAFQNRFWPHKYLIDINGGVRYDHIGEGAYEETERQIQLLLAEAGKDLQEITIETEDRFRDSSLGEATGEATNELYATVHTLYSARNAIGIKGTYIDEQPHLTGRIYLNGTWTRESDHMHHNDDSIGYLSLVFIGRTVNVVAGPGRGSSYEATVLLNGTFVSRDFAGKDLLIDAEGKSYLIVEETPRLYALLNTQVPLGIHEITILSNSREFAFWSFTFGT